MAEEAPTSWRTVRAGSPVVAADGRSIGTVAEVLGSDVDDIFHGIRLRRGGEGEDRVVLAVDINDITPERVTTRLAAADVERLEPYREAETYVVSPEALAGNNRNSPKPG